MDSQVEEIKNKLNVVDVVGSYIKLTKTGINYRGVCPFHSEKTPSFFVSPGRQMWHCFGCGSGFSIFDFIMKIEGVEFPDALRILAQKAGVELKRENPQLRSERQKLYEICELACTFFQKQLESQVGKEVLEYLSKRGILPDSIIKWRIGYSPDKWSSLTEFLIGKGFKREDIVRAGLAVEKESGNDSYDRFRGRIIFPVFDLNSQVVGFGGRVFKQGSEKEIAKYINTPQTLIYDKSNILYGLNVAKIAVRKQNQCVVTEGYTDVIMCHQAGFENTVASSGTALTSGHLSILKRYSENLVLAFDMDFAGDSATKRGISLAQEQGFNIKIIESYGNNKEKSDPADIILKNPQLWADSIEKAKSIMDYYFDSVFSNFNKETADGKKEISRILLPIIKQIPNTIEQSHWIQKLSNDMNIKEEIITSELNKISLQQSRNLTQVPEKIESKLTEPNLAADKRKKLIEEKIISLILKDPDYVTLIEQDQYHIFSNNVQDFLKEVKRLIEHHVVEDEKKLKEEFKAIISSSLSGLDLDSEFKNFLFALSLRSEIEYEEDSKNELHVCILELSSIALKERLNKISDDIKKAEEEKDAQKVANLVEEFNKLTKKL